MKIHFEDGSFIHLDESTNDNKIVTITMCGLNNDGNKLTMSSSELNMDQAKDINRFLIKIIEKLA